MMYPPTRKLPTSTGLLIRTPTLQSFYPQEF
jgi:hypothetical protein